MKFDPRWNNKRVKKIGLKNWAQEHGLKKGDTFTYKGVLRMIAGTFRWQDGISSKTLTNQNLNATQLAHFRGEFNIYDPIEAYKVKWFHKGDVYYPCADTAEREDLPPVYIQWKDAYRRNKHVRSRGFTKANI